MVNKTSQEELRSKLVNLMDGDPNGMLPDYAVEELREFPIEVTRKDGSSSQFLRTYGSFSALATVTQKYDTDEYSDEELIDEAFESIEFPKPQYKKLFDYDGSWRNVEGEDNYRFVQWLELVRGEDGYVLEPRFESRS